MEVSVSPSFVKIVYYYHFTFIQLISKNVFIVDGTYDRPRSNLPDVNVG